MAEIFSYRNFFRQMYRIRGQKYSFCAENEEEFHAWKKAFREELYEKLGLKQLEEIWESFGMKNRFHQSIRQEEAVQEKGYMRRRYVMETLPEVYMPFYMLCPDGRREGERRPAVIAIPAHGANKETVAGVPSCPEVIEKLEKTPGESYGKSFAEKGYVVFCPDPPGYGERVEGPSREDLSFMPGTRKNPLGSSCKDIAQTAEALGFSMTALEIWDLMRIVDFAAQQDCVLSEDIGCAGFSGGGQYAMWLAALDDRVGRAAVSGYVHGYYESILDTHLCPCNYAPGLWLLGDISDLCSLIAPRPLYIENGDRDVENGPRGIEGPKEQVEKIRRAYRIFGKEDLLVHCIFEGPHMWYGGCLENMPHIP